MEFNWFEKLLGPTAVETGVQTKSEEEKIEKSSVDGPAVESPEEAILLLREKSSEKKIGRGETGASFIELKDDGQGIFKEYGYQNERAAYIIDRFLGFDLVPPIVVRTVDSRKGSLQKFVPDAKIASELDYRELYGKYRDQLKKMWIFDVIIRNSDRHVDNFLVKGDRIYAIDHELSLRTDILDAEFRYGFGYWEFGGEKLPADLIARVKDFMVWVEGHRILEELLGEMLGPKTSRIIVERIKNVGRLVIEKESVPKELWE